MELSDCVLLSQTPRAVSYACAHLTRHCRDWHVIPCSVSSSHANFCHGPHLSLAAQLCEMPITVGWVLHSAVMLWSQSAQHLPEERLLFHYCKTLLPTGLATSMGMHVSYSEINRLPALHSFSSRQPLSIICFPFHSFTSHSLKVSVGLKSICWLPGLCCWKQSHFCYLFQGAGQKQPSRESIKPRGGVLRGLWLFFSFL